MRPVIVRNSWWVLSCAMVVLMGPPAVAQEPAPGEVIAEFADTHCIDCHQGWGAKGGVSLSVIPGHYLEYEPALLKSIRDQLRARNMPPVEPRLSPEELAASRPTTEELEAAIRDLEGILHARADGEGIPHVVLRRLNRVEYANAVRQLTGVDVDVESLPSDDVGQAFDHLGEVLATSPLLFEKFMNLAEATARKAIIDLDHPEPDVRVFGPGRLKGVQGSHSGAAWRNSTGEVFTHVDIPRKGRYRAEFVLGGRQAGPEPVRFSLRLNGRELDRVDVPESIGEPATHAIEFTSDVDTARISAGFINDFYRPRTENRKAIDRNAAVFELRVIGPLEPGEPTGFQRTLEAQASRRTDRTNIARAARWLLQQAWRRPITTEEALRVADLIAETARDDGRFSSRLRSLVVYALVSPEFLFRVDRPREGAEPDDDGTVPLDGYSIATRLAAFIHASVPDRELLALARKGALDEEQELRRQVRRMLDDPGSRAIAERFATQWLRVDGVERLEPDPAVFGEIDVGLLEQMRGETVRVFDANLRDDASLWDLFSSSRTFLSPGLAQHYGIEDTTPWSDTNDFVEVDLAELAPERAGLGVLAHASVLTSTSNATRTSPVKRGKWVLEAILDSPPPPAPPGVPQLPTPEEASETESLRAMLERHRADPDCAVCHMRMDAFGLAMESMDAVGRFRTRDGEELVDASTVLPDGTVIDGHPGLSELLLGNREVIRSIARHMLVYALGRGLDWRDEPLLHHLVETLMAEPRISLLIEEIVVSPQFRLLSTRKDANVQSSGLPAADDGDTVEEESNSGTKP